jgi:ribonuclease VapC
MVSSVSLLETGIVLRARSGQAALAALYELMDELTAEVIAFDEPQAKLAVAAFARFGKGMGHRAQLNFGDCAVYALAVMRGEPVLAIGRDFAATDLTLLKF